MTRFIFTPKPIHATKAQRYRRKPLEFCKSWLTVRQTMFSRVWNDILNLASWWIWSWQEVDCKNVENKNQTANVSANLFCALIQLEFGVFIWLFSRCNHWRVVQKSSMRRLKIWVLWCQRCHLETLQELDESIWKLLMSFFQALRSFSRKAYYNLKNL